MPKTGVYVADILLSDKIYYGVTHIGTRPTLDNDSFVSIETHIFDFDKDIYGCTITVNLYKKLREVRKFNELSLLLEQITNDRTMAQEFWGLKQTNHTLHIDVNRHCVILEQQEVYLSTNEFDFISGAYIIIGFRHTIREGNLKSEFNLQRNIGEIMTRTEK